MASQRANSASVEELFTDVKVVSVPVETESPPTAASRIDQSRSHIATTDDLAFVQSSLRSAFGGIDSDCMERLSRSIFRHGFDLHHRPCLVIRLGRGILNFHQTYLRIFVHAIVAHVDYEVRQFAKESDRITVLVDCECLWMLKFPLQLMKSLLTLLQDRHPGMLGDLFIIRLPPAAQILAESFLEKLQPRTREKVHVLGGAYCENLSGFFKSVPAIVGGDCTCYRCGKIRTKDENFEQQCIQSDHNIVNAYVLILYAFFIVGWIMLCFLVW